jgi:NADH:ubiquinone oxidoreductase subunit E
MHELLKILKRYPAFQETLETIEKYPPAREHMLDMLHDLQDRNPRCYLSKEALETVALYLNLPLSEVASTASFYTMYSLAPRGKHVIRMCVSPPCHALGGSTILNVLKDILHVDIGGTSSDGLFTLETASCLGVCGVAPAMMIDDDVYGNLTDEKIERIIEEIRRRDAAH